MKSFSLNFFKWSNFTQRCLSCFSFVAYENRTFVSKMYNISIRFLAEGTLVWIVVTLNILMFCKKGYQNICVRRCRNSLQMACTKDQWSYSTILLAVTLGLSKVKRIFSQPLVILNAQLWARAVSSRIIWLNQKAIEKIEGLPQLYKLNYYYAFVSGAGGLRFKSPAGQIVHSAANGLPPLQQFFEKSKLCWPGAMTRRWASQTRSTLWRNTASIAKDVIWCCKISWKPFHKRSLNLV